ncbi:SDR family NAD(P)-dependent oxidoreductase [candidate division KSB1 bacterium]
MSDLDQLLKLSHLFGKDPDFVLAGGGNTSVKTAETLYIKPSGTTLATIKKKEFVTIDRKKIRKILKKKYNHNLFKREEQVKQDLLSARLDFNPNSYGPRPSVETCLHEIIDHKFVVHTHPNLINGLTCSKNGKKIADQLFRNNYIWVDSTNPGYKLTKVLEKKLKQHKKKQKGGIPKIILIQNHGLIVSGDTIEDIVTITKNIVTKIIKYIKTTSKSIQPVFIPARNKKLSKKEKSSILKVASPTLRGLLSTDIRKIIIFDDSEDIQKVISSSNGRQIATKGTFSPDHMVYCKEKSVWIDYNTKYSENGDNNALVKKLQTELSRYRKINKVEPKIVFIQETGMLAVGDSLKEAEIARDVYKDFIKIAENTSAFGGPLFMTKPKVDFIEKWEAESYRKKIIRRTSNSSIQNRVAIITGAGQGIGEGIARGLAKEGAYVVIADLNLKKAERVAKNLNEQCGSGSAVAIKVDVTNTAEIKKMIDKTIKLYGGLDILINNAGILISGPTECLTDKQLDMMTRVNYQAFFKVVRETVPIMKRQTAFNRNYTSDIILMSSKSGLQGSPANALYSGSKFGGIGLMQSFAYEYIKYGIKVNAVCPGNYFEGPLWADNKKGLFVQYLKAGKVPGAKNIEDVKKFYKSKCPMGKGVSLEDINKAIIYVIEQQYETGQAVPVTGGQIMLK